LNYSLFHLASELKDRGMSACADLRGAEFAAEASGYSATEHPREVGSGYFDAVGMAISGG